MGFASLGKLPRLKYENLGLRDTLAGIDIASIVAGLLVNEEASAQNALTIDTSDPNFLNDAKLGLYQYLAINEYIATGVILGNQNLFKAFNEGEETEGEVTENEKELLEGIAGLQKVSGNIKFYSDDDAEAEELNGKSPMDIIKKGISVVGTFVQHVWFPNHLY